MKLARMRIIPHHTSGDAKPLIPVQENASSGAATSLAPRFKRSSEANTHTTLRPSCSHGLPKPNGRFCIRFSSARSKHRNRFRIPRLGRARHSVRAAPSACRGLPALPHDCCDQSSCAFGNFCNTGSCRVGPRYLITRRNIGFSSGFVCLTYRSSGTSSQSRCSFGS
jgi:hypothetical protein